MFIFSPYFNYFRVPGDVGRIFIFKPPLDEQQQELGVNLVFTCTIIHVIVIFVFRFGQMFVFNQEIICFNSHTFHSFLFSSFSQFT